MVKTAGAVKLLTLLVAIGIATQFGFAARSAPASTTIFNGTIVDREGVGIDHQFRMDINCCIDTINVSPEPQPNIGVNGYFASDRAQRGRVVQAAIVMEIPAGYHVNANRPLGKYAIPTTLKIDGSGVTVGAISYPRAIVRKLKATNNEALAVYEGRAIFRFNVTVPANYQGSVNVKAHLRYQSCNDEVCFPPKNQETDLGIDVVGPTDRVQRTNGWVFGGKR